MKHKLIDIFWERIFLHIIYESHEKVKLVLKKDDKVIDLESKKIDENKYEIIINTVAVKNRLFLENGKWKIGALDVSTETGEPILDECEVSEELAYKTENLDKIFRYGSQDTYAYTVNFELYSEDDINMHLLINSLFMKKNKEWKKRKVIEEAYSFNSYRKKLTLSIVKKCINVFYQIMTRVLPKKGTKILIMSETTDVVTGNLKAISERLYERNLDKQFKIKHTFRKSIGKRNSMLNWIGTTLKIAESDYIFVDNFVPIFGFIELDKRVNLIQVWHAGGGFKAVGYCRFGKKGSPFPAESSHKKYTHALAGSTSLIKVFEEVFGIEKDVFIPVGMPRLDNFLDEKKIESFRDKFYKKYPKLKEKKIILFAPTYRGVGQKTAFYDYSRINFKELYDFCGNEYIVLMKMHPFIDEKPEIEEYSDRIINFSDYPHINELYYITDILITDYSSCYYEFSLMKRPMIFYTYDRTLYEMTRGVYQYVKDSAPGKVCDNFEELMLALRNKDYELEKVEKFVKNNYGEYNNNATDRLIDAVLLKKL